MNGVLVDTSVWVDHFRQRNEALAGLLELDQVLTHPLIVGEIACGTPPRRERTLTDLDALQPSGRPVSANAWISSGASVCSGKAADWSTCCCRHRR